MRLVAAVVLFHTVVAVASYVEVSEDQCQMHQGAKLCVQAIECPHANHNYVRIIDFDKEVSAMQIPGGTTLYSTGTSLVGCIGCAASRCAAINATLPIISNAEDNQCVLEGGSHGEKVRIPLALENSPGSDWEWPTNETLNYTNWLGSPPVVPVHAMQMCTTMGPNGKWSATPCDMSQYHTQKDFVVCTVASREEGSPDAEPSISNSESDDGGVHAAYYVAPVVAIVLIAVIVIWRRSLDVNDQKESVHSVISHNFDQERIENKNNGDSAIYSNSMRSVDSTGYLQPGAAYNKVSLSPDANEEENQYYEACNLDDDASTGTNSESDLNSSSQGGLWEMAVIDDDDHYDIAIENDSTTDDTTGNNNTPHYSIPKNNITENSENSENTENTENTEEHNV